MAEGGVALLLYINPEELAQAISSVEVEGAADALQKYGTLVQDVLVDLCGSKEFSHVEFLQVGTSYKSGDVTSPLAVVVGEPLKSEEGQLIGVSDVKHVLDVYGALTATNSLPEVIGSRVGLDEDGMLGFTDSETQKLASKHQKALKLDSRYQELLSEEAEDALAEALGAQLPEDSQLSPVHPEDLLHTLPVFLSLAAGAAPRSRKSGPGLVKRGQQLVGRVVHVPAGLLRMLGRRSQAVTQNLWRLEDLLTLTGRAAIKVARKAVRPVLVGYVLHRALTTIENSKDVGVRMAKLPQQQAIDLYYRELLGDDYGKQMEADLLDAVAEVEAGLVTEEYKEEKRLLTAAMLRRLEVEEWDKERMKHFYLGSYGMGPWYFDMEERLHNPYFMGARAWNGPVESWIGQNKIYPNDMPVEANDDVYALAAIEHSLGRTLTPSQKLRVLGAARVRPADVLTAKGGLLDGVVDKQAVREHLAAQP